MNSLFDIQTESGQLWLDISAQLDTIRKEGSDALAKAQADAKDAADKAAAALAEATGKNLDSLHFAWAGVLDRSAGHYYRIQGKTFVVEFDNTQNEANHIHTVWRNFAGDFGHDVLAAHYAREHAKK